MKTTSKPSSPVVAAKSPEEEEIDRLLGDRILFDITDPQKFGGPSPPVLYRAWRGGMIELLRIGGRTKLTRVTMKRILLEGLGRVNFYYAKTKKRA
jgi:hypothetical protein